MASMQCRCGKVELKFPSTMPRVSTECCCDSCRHRVEFLSSLGGPRVPDKPLLASKWDNCIEILKGAKHLFAYKLNPETMVVNVAAGCCHTFLLGRHAGYDANCVTTSSDFPVFLNLDEGSLVPSSRWFTNQWDPERLAKYDKLVEIWVDVDSGSIVGDEGWEEVFRAHQESMSRDIPSGAKGMSFDEILDQIGKDTMIIVSQEPKAATR